MSRERTKKVTYEIEANDSLKLSHKVEHSNKPRITFNVNGEDLVAIALIVLMCVMLSFLAR